jgi:ParB/RepB/Spo0J family partition protein
MTDALHSFLTAEADDSLAKISLHLIDANPSQDRYDWEDKETIEHISSLSVGIKAAGDVSDPIKVIPGDNGRFTLIDGECRLRAAKKAELDNISALIKRGLSVEQASSQALHTQTNKLVLKPIALARALKRRIDDEGWTVAKLIEVTGKSKAWISKRLSLLDLPEEIQKLAEDSIVIDPDNLKKIAKLSESAQIEAVLGLRSGELAVKDIGKPKAKVKTPKENRNKKPNLPTSIKVSRNDIKRILFAQEGEWVLDDDCLQEEWNRFLVELGTSDE